MRVAIIGSRTLNNQSYEKLCQLVPIGASEIISGGAMGVDKLAERYAKENHLRFTAFLPNYKKYGKTAPILRNTQLVSYSDYVIALWDGTSRGTGNAIATCIKEYTPVRVLLCKDGKILSSLF